VKAASFYMAGLVLCTLGLYAQPQQPTPPAQSGYRIAGTVVNSLTGQPIAVASVGIAPTTNPRDNDISKTVTTGADGRFSFAGLPRGKYSLMAAAHGFILQSFEHHDDYASAIAVGPDLDSEHLVFRMEPDASIDGQISDENNDFVEHATVRLFQRKIQDGLQKTVLANQAQADDQGRYHIGRLPPGTYFVAVSARPWYAQNPRSRPLTESEDPEVGVGARARQEAAALDVTYPLTFYPDARDSAGASPIALTAGVRVTADVVMHTVPAVHLRIHVPDMHEGSASGPQAIGFNLHDAPRVSQSLFEGYLDPIFTSSVSWTGAGPGAFDIGGLAPGHYVLEMPVRSGLNENARSRAWYREVDLSGDTELNASESPSLVTVSGSLVFQGAPSVPKGTFLLLSNPVTGESFRGPILEKGQFDFNADQIRPGRYNVLLGNAQGFSLQKCAVTGAKMTGRLLEIGKADSVRLGCLATRGVAQITGVALHDGKPFSGAMIVLVPQDLSDNVPLVRRDQSDSDGSFSLANVVPGSYTVVAITHGWDLEWGNPVALQPYLKGGEAIRVTGDGTMEVKVQVQ
jgi:hypothetical protein